MKLTKRKIRFLTVLFLSVLVLTACETAPEVPSNTDDEQLWTASFYESAQDISDFSYPVIQNGYIYYTQRGSDFNVSVDSETGQLIFGPTRYFRLKIGSDEAPEELKLGGKAETYTLSAFLQPDYDGNLFVCFGSNDLAKYDSEGNELYSVHITGKLNTSPYYTAVDSEGNFYMSNLTQVLLFNSDCTYKGTINMESGCNGIISFDGKVYALSFGQELLEISFDSVSLGDKISSKLFSMGLAQYADIGFMRCHNGTVYSYDVSTQTVNALVLLADCGIKEDDVSLIGSLEDGSIVLLLKENDNYRLAVLKKSSTVKKQIITIGTFDSSTVLKNHVAEFNRSSEECLVIIKQYYDSTTDNTVGETGRQDALTRFHLDIASNNCPDILNLDFDDLAAYAKKGLFDDLTPYLKASGLNVIENITEAYTFDGTLAAIPYAVQLRTIVGRSEDIEGAAGWTLDEMIEYIEAHPNETVFDVGSNVMLEYCLKLNQSEFVDWENYTCDFESEKFCNLLKFCSRYSGGDSFINTHPEVNIASYDASLYEVTLTTPSDYIVLQQLLDDESITFVGFPTSSGTGTIVEEFNGSYAISSNSENKEAAWQFIESLITYVSPYDFYNVKNGYSVVNETRAAYFENAMSEPWEKDEYGNNPTVERRKVHSGNVAGIYAEYYIPFEEELAPIVDLLENAEVAVTNDSTILDIILENAEEYFDGEKSVEEAAKQIQSRVKIYLNERK